MKERGEAGFTLLEMLIAMSMFAILSIGFYSVMLSANRGARTTRDVVRVTEEGRLGLTRMIRDTRQADIIYEASPTSYSIKVDLDQDGDYENTPGNYEDVTVSYEATGSVACPDREDFEPGCIVLEAGTETGRLAVGVTPIPGEDMFTYSSQLLDYDWNADGVTSWQELDEAPTRGYTDIGDNCCGLSAGELPYLSKVSYAFVVTSQGATSTFRSQAQLRNCRGTICPGPLGASPSPSPTA